MVQKLETIKNYDCDVLSEDDKKNIDDVTSLINSKIRENDLAK